MDKETFQDSTVSAFMNEEFISLKWNAEEAKFIESCKKYNVNAYPTFLIFNSDHELILHHKGFLRAPTFEKQMRDVLSMIMTKPLDEVKIPSLNYEESKRILEQVSWYESSKKNNLLVHFIDLIGTNDSLFNANIELIAKCMFNEINTIHLHRLIDNYKPITKTLDFNILESRCIF